MLKGKDLVLALVVVVLVVLICRKMEMFSGVVPVGGACKLHMDCQGYGPKPTDAACCKGVCKRKMKDWAGVGACPSLCVDKPGSPPGSCGKKLGQKCKESSDCAGHGTGPTDTACCKGVCKRKMRDWAGVGYCPSVCVGKVGGKPGTCQ